MWNSQMVNIYAFEKEKKYLSIQELFAFQWKKLPGGDKQGNNIVLGHSYCCNQKP